MKSSKAGIIIATILVCWSLWAVRYIVHQRQEQGAARCLAAVEDVVSEVEQQRNPKMDAALTKVLQTAIDRDMDCPASFTLLTQWRSAYGTAQ